MVILRWVLEPCSVWQDVSIPALWLLFWVQLECCQTGNEIRESPAFQVAARFHVLADRYPCSSQCQRKQVQDAPIGQRPGHDRVSFVQLHHVTTLLRTSGPSVSPV